MASGTSDDQRSVYQVNLLNLIDGAVLMRAPIIFSPFVLVGLVAAGKDRQTVNTVEVVEGYQEVEN